MLQNSGGLWQKMFGDRDGRVGTNKAAIANERLSALRGLQSRYAGSTRQGEFCPDELSAATGLNKVVTAAGSGTGQPTGDSDSDGDFSCNPSGCSLSNTLADRIYRKAWTDESPSLRERDRQSIRRWFNSSTSYDEQAIMDRLQPVGEKLNEFGAARQPVDYDYLEVQAAALDPYEFGMESQGLAHAFEEHELGVSNLGTTSAAFDSICAVSFYASESGLIQKAELSSMLEPSILSGMGIYQSDRELDPQAGLDMMPPVEALEDIPDIAELLTRLQQLESQLPVSSGSTESYVIAPKSEADDAVSDIAEETSIPLSKTKISLRVTDEIVIPKLVVTEEIEIPRLVVVKDCDDLSDIEAEAHNGNAVSIKDATKRRKKRARKQKVLA